MHNRHLSHKILAALLAVSVVTSSFPVEALAEAADLLNNEPTPAAAVDESSADAEQSEVASSDEDAALELDDPFNLDESEASTDQGDNPDPDVQGPQPFDTEADPEAVATEESAEESAAQTESGDEPASPAEQEAAVEPADDASPEDAAEDATAGTEQSPADAPAATAADPAQAEADPTQTKAEDSPDKTQPQAEQPATSPEEAPEEETAGPVLTGMATAADLKNSKIWIKQTNINGWGTCTVCAAAMMLRRAAILNGKSESYWLGITEKAMVNNSAVWAGDAGLYSNFTAYGMTVKQVRITVTNDSLKKLLDAHPEGIVVYNGKHAVLLTDYTGSDSSIKFYCADSAYGDRRLLTNAANNVRVGTITSYWYVSSKVSPIEPTGMNQKAANSNTVYDIPSRYYSLRSKYDPTKAVEIKGASTASGAAAQLNVFKRTATQLFVINPSNIKGAYTLRNSATSADSAQLLMVKGSSSTNQTAIVQSKSSGLNSQKWYIEKNTDGTYSVRNVNSGLYLDIQGGGANNETVISQWKPTGEKPPTSSRFYLVPANCTLWDITLSNTNGTYEYTGSPIDPGVTAWTAPTCPNFQAVEGIDYSLELSNNVNVGTATYRVIENASNGHEQAGTFTIAAAPISKASASSVASQTYTGKAIKPKPTLKFNGKTLVEGTDYSLSYKNNVNAGTATITITGKGNFRSTKSVTFTITSKSLSKATVSSIATQKWTGSAVKPQPTVKLGSKTLVNGTDYTLSYKSNINPGTATVTVKGKGNYAGSVSSTFKIGPRTGSWQQSGSRWWYRWDDGTRAKSQFLTISGKTYYLDASGWMVTGWKSISGSWYWFASNGVMAKGWKQISGAWYWFASNGKMAKGLKTISGQLYYFNSSGAMVTGWQQVLGKWYYFEASGAAAKSKWVGDYWLGADGVMATNAWVDGGKYYVGADGKWVA